MVKRSIWHTQLLKFPEDDHQSYLHNVSKVMDVIESPTSLKNVLCSVSTLYRKSDLLIRVKNDMLIIKNIYNQDYVSTHVFKLYLSHKMI